MLIQLEVKDTQSDFFLNLLNQLKASINSIKIIEPKQIQVTKEEMQNDTYFEITDSHGIHHKVANWKDGEFERLGLESFFKDEEEISTKELFDS